MRWIRGTAGLAFACAICFGVYLGISSWHGTVYVTGGMYHSDDNERTPAAIRKVLDVSNLEGTALTAAVQNRLLSDIKIAPSPSGIGIELGHFVTRDDSGEKVFACRYYNRVEMLFVADGVIEGGERPTMTVEGACNYTLNINRIDPIYIPVAKILAERPGDLELSFNEPDPVNLRFRNMGGVWPHNWSLYSVRMFDQENLQHTITIGEGEMRKLFSRLKSITF